MLLASAISRQLRLYADSSRVRPLQEAPILCLGRIHSHRAMSVPYSLHMHIHIQLFVSARWLQDASMLHPISVRLSVANASMQARVLP